MNVKCLASLPKQGRNWDGGDRFFYIEQRVEVIVALEERISMVEKNWVLPSVMKEDRLLQEAGKNFICQHHVYKEGNVKLLHGIASVDGSLLLYAILFQTTEPTK